MIHPTRASLLSTLVAQYKSMRESLTRRLRSHDLASEALHELWIRLGQGGDLPPVADQKAYLYRSALYTAYRLRKTQQRHQGDSEVNALLSLVDDAPGPDRIVEGRSELRALQKALGDLTPRQREIFVAVMFEGIELTRLAERYDVSLRWIQMELRTAVLHCMDTSARRKLFASDGFRVSK